MNRHIRTLIIAPMTPKGRSYPTRIQITFQRKEGQIALDQIRTIDKSRLVKRLGRMSPQAETRVLNTLQEMFS